MTPDGHYEYLRVAFGLVNAPEYFQKIMISIFKEIDINIYIDDILIAANSINEGFEQLEKVLEVLKKQKLINKYF